LRRFWLTGARTDAPPQIARLQVKNCR
jgi:hypothetical protein